ncbi:hypothetical protein QUA07_04930 [Microcoleus sp. T3_A4]|uniref:hypothetical protein n=1 Tax=Microcoleus sp. T3_A4 TaxID=2818968 RepID=UPI002FD5BB6C
MSEPLYDPSNYRPGMPGWTGQIGKLAFVNTTNKTVFVKLYHPDAPDRVYSTHQIDPDKNIYLADSVGMDWGIQVNDSPIRIVGLVSDWNLFEGEHIFQTWPARVTFFSEIPLYDPSNYRPGMPGWTGQIGKLAFVNTTNKTVFVKLYDPDVPNRIHSIHQIDSDQNIYLADSVGMDWGIQVNDSPIRIVGLVSDWNLFNGEHIFQTWPDKVKVGNPQTALNDTIEQIYQFLYESLTGNSSGRNPIEQKNIFLTINIPGEIVDTDQFANPWLPDNTSGSTVALENFALLVNSIPLVSYKHIPSGSFVDFVYGEIVANANVQTVSPNPSEVATYEAAYNLLYVDSHSVDTLGNPITMKIESLEYRDYLDKRATYRNALLEYASSSSQYSELDPVKWALLVPELDKKVSLAWSNLQTPQSLKIEAALDILRSAGSSTIATMFSNAKRIYETTKRASLINPLLTWHLTSAFPTKWFDVDSINFTPIATEFFSLEFARVEIRRPWLNPDLFSFEQWSVAGRQKGSYSTGILINNKGIFPLLPTGFIIARNLSVTANINGANVQLLSQPKLQIIAWINRVIPFCPHS